MDVSLNDLRAFAVRHRVDVLFLVSATEAAWMVNRRGLVARPPRGDSTRAGVEATLAAADVFIIEGEREPRQRLARAQFLELMAARAAAGARQPKDEES
jgi:hypothetical protein